MAATPSIGMLGSGPGAPEPGEGDGLGDAFGPLDAVPPADADGDPLGLETVVPNGVGEAACVLEDPGAGVGVGGLVVGFGVGRGVAVGLGVAVGGGVGAGVGDGVGGGVGALTTTGVARVNCGLFPSLVTEWKTTVQLPAGNVFDPVHIPSRVVPEIRVRDVVRVVDPLDATALTLLAVSPAVVFPT